MEPYLFLALVSFTAGFFWGRQTTKAAFVKIFKSYRDEMYSQYVSCLKAHNIEVKDSVSEKPMNRQSVVTTYKADKLAS